MTLLAHSGWSEPISFSYEDGNQVVELPSEPEDGWTARLARIDSRIARLFCTETNTGRDVLWPEELSVYRVGWLESVRVPEHRMQEVYISCSEQYVVYKFGLRIAMIEPERRQRIKFSLI